MGFFYGRKTSIIIKFYVMIITNKEALQSLVENEVFDYMKRGEVAPSYGFNFITAFNVYMNGNGIDEIYELLENEKEMIMSFEEFFKETKEEYEERKKEEEQRNKFYS